MMMPVSSFAVQGYYVPPPVHPSNMHPMMTPASSVAVQGYVPPDVATASKGSKKSKKSKEKFNNLRSSSKKLRSSKKSKKASNKLISSKKSKKASNKLISSKASRKEKLKETMPNRTKKSLKYAHTHIDLGTLDEATLRRFDQAKSRRLCNDAAEFAVFHVQVSESLTGAAGGLRACGQVLEAGPRKLWPSVGLLACPHHGSYARLALLARSTRPHAGVDCHDVPEEPWRGECKA